jgi:hypothetical protein
MSSDQSNFSQPWWRFGHVWLVVSGPLLVVIASVVSGWIAFQGMFTASALQGALVMAVFALGGGLMLTVFPWLWSQLMSSNWGQKANWGQYPINFINWILTPISSTISRITPIQSIGTRLSGLMLALTAAWGMYSNLMHGPSPWCLPGFNN